MLNSGITTGIAAGIAIPRCDR